MDARKIHPALSVPIKPLEEQVAILRDVFPGLAMPDLGFAARCVTPPEADGWFAAMSCPSIAESLQFLARCNSPQVHARFPFKSHLRGFVDAEQSEGVLGVRLRYMYGALTHLHYGMLRSMQGKPDIILFPGQFGILHPERSVRDLNRSRLLKDDEFLLGLPEVLCMLLTHPERLAAMGAPALVCGNDSVSSPDGNNIDVPVFSAAYFGTLLTGIKPTDTATVLSTPSGFVPMLREHIGGTID